MRSQSDIEEQLMSVRLWQDIFPHAPKIKAERVAAFRAALEWVSGLRANLTANPDLSESASVGDEVANRIKKCAPSSVGLSAARYLQKHRDGQLTESLHESAAHKTLAVGDVVSVATCYGAAPLVLARSIQGLTLIAEAIETRISEIISGAVDRALAGRPEVNREGMVNAIKRECKQLLEAAKLGPQIEQMRADVDRLRAERRESLLPVMKELAAGRRALKELQSHMQTLGHNLALCRSLPAVPAGHIVPSEDGFGFPDSSGVYFAFDVNGQVAYVGQSTKLCGRCTLSHEKLRRTDRLSYVQLPIDQLNVAEQFYIGICFPYRNGRWTDGKRSGNAAG